MTANKRAKAAKSNKATKAPITSATPHELDIPANLKREPTAQKPVITKPDPTQTTKKAEAKPPKAVKVQAAKKATAPSMSHALKALVVRAPKMPLDELVSKLEAAGFKGRSRVTISTLQSDALTTLRAAAEAGLFPRWD